MAAGVFVIDFCGWAGGGGGLAAVRAHSRRLGLLAAASEELFGEAAVLFQRAESRLVAPLIAFFPLLAKRRLRQRGRE